MSAANQPEQIQYFLDQYQQAFTDNTLQRVVLSKYQGDEADLNRVTIRPVLLKNAVALSFLYEYQTRHVTKNLSLNESLALLTQELSTHYKNAHMVSDTKEIQLRFSKKGKALINEHRVIGAKTELAQPDLSQNLAHNREKHRFVKQDRPYLAALGVTDARGQIIPAMSRKWKQINKFIEVLSGAIENTGLVERQEIHIADFGSGKAYLTFAVHDYLCDTLTVKPQVTGVELRQGLVDLCNQTAAKLALQGIKFEQGDVQHFAAQNINIMIALHACDTATDYAINMGIRSNADIIMCSPCCHKQIRPQLKSPSILAPLLQHGIHLGQEAEMLTDGLRALLLEAHDYDTQVFEFISLEHTNKNKMILAQKRKVPRDNSAILTQIADLKRFYGVKEHCLEELLNQQVD
ncbi:class I SAM-dependent methyltransferase [Zhongshania aquimaris]|uniref:SAM-dependent methyltransferase n=1 Tax=Zhongshania aquimaris TaxID=2857107 RepID=A0ABS6VSE8_9GAMM|nr:SAM-dependent methyltransferase [Zhongshania aquimaris]MBW2940964.1 SAM-dependent methyltransferase [Zhongshania aquimaris]